MRKTLDPDEVEENVLRADHRDLQRALQAYADRKRIIAKNAAWEAWVGTEKYWDFFAAHMLRLGDWRAP